MYILNRFPTKKIAYIVNAREKFRVNRLDKVGSTIHGTQSKIKMSEVFLKTENAVCLTSSWNSNISYIVIDFKTPNESPLQCHYTRGEEGRLCWFNTYETGPDIRIVSEYDWKDIGESRLKRRVTKIHHINQAVKGLRREIVRCVAMIFFLSPLNPYNRIDDV